MNKKEMSAGITLSAGNKSLVRRALLCRTGKFEGMYGEVTVTKEMLEKIAEKYTTDKANPTNENDFVPILIDHVRSADLCKGRLLAQGMAVEEWKELDGIMEYGLFGDLRIDDKEASENVDSGKYAQLSISFDEETGELFEVSFVAVEAARGAIVLNKNPKGGDRMHKKNLAMLQAKHTALKGAIGDNRKKRKAALAAIAKEMNDLQGELVVLEKASKTIALKVKTGTLKGKFHEFVRGGKMSPAEVKSLDFTALAALDQTSLGIVLGSYSARAVSTDVHQYGQKASDSKVVLDMSPAKMREAIKLQRSGKGPTLSAEEIAEQDKEKKKDDENLSDDDKDKDESSTPMSAEDMKACLEEMEGHHAKMAEVMSKMKGLSESAKKLAEGEDGDEEKELAAEDSAKADDEDEDDKDKK